MYTVEKKTTPAFFSRAPGSTLLLSDRLKLAYNKYKCTGKLGDDVVKINLVFAHGTGMNKTIWDYHIKRLFEIESQTCNWAVDTVVAVDAVGHGDSAILNEGKMGYINLWEEGGKDLIEVVKNEQKEGCFINGPMTKNILIGHSLGGFMAVLAAFYEPHLFDGVVPVEGVLYSSPDYTERYTKVFKKLKGFLVDTFESEQEYAQYFKEVSFYKNMHPEILLDFMESEKIEWIDPKTRERKIKTKLSTDSQMSTYICSFYSIPFGMSILPLLRVPVWHVTGSKATWNPKESTQFVRETIPKELLKGTYDIASGGHLVIAEEPDALLDIFREILQQSADEAIKNHDRVVEIFYKGNKEKIAKHQWTLMNSAKLEEAKAYLVVESKAKF